MTLTNTQIKNLAAKAVAGLGTFFKLTPEQEMDDNMSPADAAEVCIVAIIKEALAMNQRAYGDAPASEGIHVLDPKWNWAYLNMGRKYVSENKPTAIGANGFLAAGRDYEEAPWLPDLDLPKESLHQIIDGKLVKCQWVPEDNEPVMVKETEGDEWRRRYSTGRVEDGELICYWDGKTKWSAGPEDVFNFPIWRKPTEEELK